MTLYDSKGFFVSNPAKIYLVNNRSHVDFNADHSLDIYIQTAFKQVNASPVWVDVAHLPQLAAAAPLANCFISPPSTGCESTSMSRKCTRRISSPDCARN